MGRRQKEGTSAAGYSISYSEDMSCFFSRSPAPAPPPPPPPPPPPRISPTLKEHYFLLFSNVLSRRGRGTRPGYRFTPTRCAPYGCLSRFRSIYGLYSKYTVNLKNDFFTFRRHRAGRGASH